MLLHGVVLLLPSWSLAYRSRTHFASAPGPKLGYFAKVTPAPYHGKPDFVPITVTKVHGDNILAFTFSHRQFLFDAKKNGFSKIEMPTHHAFGHYRHSIGKHPGEADAMALYGPNAFRFPSPTFKDLFREHALAPFFVFQVFCVALWCLDEFWYFALLTLFILCLFESTVVFQRLRNLSSMRDMIKTGGPVQCLRHGKWVEVAAEELYPGDVIALWRSDDEVRVPADCLLLGGTAIVNEALLTGESLPQMKESIHGREDDEKLHMKSDKIHLLYNGTLLLQQSGVSEAERQSLAAAHQKIHLPNNGKICLCMVLRTGFRTSQGKLMRMILHSQDRVSANNGEAFALIAFLLLWALLAAGYVIYRGMSDPARSYWRMFLTATMIVTSVVPPELPMELSIAVNSSLVQLVKKGVVCTEPFRIPYAGKVFYACFDKTGTLTSDQLEMKGVAGLRLMEHSTPSPPTNANDDNDDNDDNELAHIPEPTIHVLAGCHSLVSINNEIVGDPLEKAAMATINWVTKGGDVSIPRHKGQSTSKRLVRILKRFHFQSSLQRMTCLVEVEGSSVSAGLTTGMVVCKGSPEAIRALLKTVPAAYESTYDYYTQRGYRVIALAYRYVHGTTMSAVKNMHRDEAESQLLFAGFGIFSCPLMPDSLASIQELQESSHQTIMITGDNILTAVHVARDTGICAEKASALVLTVKTSDEGERRVLQWKGIQADSAACTEATSKALAQLSSLHVLCVTGQTISEIQAHPALRPAWLQVVKSIKVMARMSPTHKEYVLRSLSTLNIVTMMCGDGTNDVGALKAADVGVALVTRIVLNDDMKEKREKERLAKEAARKEELAKIRANPGGRQRLSWKQMMAEASLQMEQKKAEARMKNGGKGPGGLEMDEPELVQLGDASIAAPFTSRVGSVRSCVDLIRQGRCTLVTTAQMFKILALNCLLTAYSLSVLYLDGVKFGDTQKTFASIFVAACFMFVAHSKPLPRLSRRRPQARIFNWYLVLSVVGQFAIHMFFLINMVKSAEFVCMEESPFESPLEISDPDGEFEANMVNTVCFLFIAITQVTIFAVNYKGHPFMESLWENKYLRYAVIGSTVSGAILVLELFPDFNAYLEMTPFPSLTFRFLMLVNLIWDIVLTLLWEWWMDWMLGQEKIAALSKS